MANSLSKVLDKVIKPGQKLCSKCFHRVKENLFKTKSADSTESEQESMYVEESLDPTYSFAAVDHNIDWLFSNESSKVQ